MSKRTSVWLVVLTVVLLVLGVRGTSAGQFGQAGAGKPVMDQAAIQRSWAVQAELARIEANKEAFVGELFVRWAPYLDPMVYDLWGSLKPVAMAATPWRLLGASLTSDFESGLLVLQGAVGPGWYVSAYVEGREPVIGSGAVQAQVGAFGLGAAAIGAQLGSLVFTPIAPCRIVDTRGSGSRTGIMTAGSMRTFDLSAYGLFAGQGGETSCIGLPAYQHEAWAVNITVFGYSENGHLTVWGYGHAKPATSFMNFFPAAYAVANAGTVTGCYGCTNSIHVSVAATTHVIIDVMGYYEEATGFATGAVTQLSGGPLTIVWPNEYSTKFGPECPAGTVLIGGSGSSDSWGKLVISAVGFLNKGYWMSFFNTSSTTSYNAGASSHCMDVL